FACFLVAARMPGTRALATPLWFALALSAVLAQASATGDIAWISAIVSAAASLALALRPVAEAAGEREGHERCRMLGAIGAPLFVALWMGCCARTLPGSPWQWGLAFAAATAIATVSVGVRSGVRSAGWINEVADVFAVGLAFVLALSTLFRID